MPPYQVEPGRPRPLGATPDRDGVNFSVFSQRATMMQLLLFAGPDDPAPTHVVYLDAMTHRTFHFWHAYVRGVGPGWYYAYRAGGPADLHGAGDRFNMNKVLLDPYARGIRITPDSRASAMGAQDNLAAAIRGEVLDVAAYDWEDDRPPRTLMKDSIIYELHVRGFTQSPSAGCHRPGTFAGLCEKIPYLRSLGITAIELLPIFAFDPGPTGRRNPLDGSPLVGYWGYNPLAYFAPHGAYCFTPEAGQHIQEFRDMVKALHRAGIEVILDVVFNHTGEGDASGPTISFRGLDNATYYILDPDDKAIYRDYTGCQNTVNCNHPVTAKLIADCLSFWVREMHVDGFRFDEASVLSRGPDGRPMEYPPVVWQVELDDTLADTKVIAEAWDAAGLYQVGYFPGFRFADWNGRYRDDIRRFVRGDGGLVGAVASRVAGSSDLYGASDHLPINSVNFVTCHDGFTLRDLVSYDVKHNEANGEDNRDGSDTNYSWNCGVEGETDYPAILALRLRQSKNVLAILMLSQGVPMVLAGDEVGRTQGGNNNAYCQDNPTSWFDWTLLEANAELLRFFKGMVAFRTAHAGLRRDRYFTGQPDSSGLPDIEWHGTALHTPPWNDPGAQTLAFTMWARGEDRDLHVMLNMSAGEQQFAVPRARQGTAWYVAVDTVQPPPRDVAMPGDEPPLTSPDSYTLATRAVAVLLAR